VENVLYLLNFILSCEYEVSVTSGCSACLSVTLY
jgi:hypothetical protein